LRLSHTRVPQPIRAACSGDFSAALTAGAEDPSRLRRADGRRDLPARKHLCRATLLWQDR